MTFNDVKTRARASLELGMGMEGLVMHSLTAEMDTRLRKVSTAMSYVQFLGTLLALKRK